MTQVESISPGVETTTLKAREMGDIIGACFAWLFVLLVMFVSIAELKPPKPAAVTAPLTEFSAERALVHIRAIATAPHPVGSDADGAVAKYLLAQLQSLGCHPQMFDAMGVHQAGGAVVIAQTHDIVGRLPGRASSGAILLMAHYDSVTLAPGAADDGAAVGAILESLRVLRAGPPLRNDVIVLYTDGEEAGELGAEAFATSHPWMSDIGLILNFEARGARGPSLLFETSAGNSALIEAAARSESQPIGSSLFYALYRRLPNDTDFTIFRRYNIPGLNFAFGENLEAYHTSLDSLQNLSLASVQHQGSYVLKLSQQFGESDLGRLKSRQHDDVFFNWLGSGMIAYSNKWILPGELLVTLVLLGAIVLNLRRARLQPSPTVRAILVSVTILIIVPAVLGAVQWILSRFLAAGMSSSDSPANSCFMIGLVALGVGTAGLLFVRFRWRFSLQELSQAGLMIVAIWSWLIALTLPAGSYLLFWPLLLMSLGQLAIAFQANPPPPLIPALVGLPATVATILLFVPLGYLLYVFLTFQLITAIAIGFLVAVFVLIAIPILHIAIPISKWHVAIAVLFVSALTFVSIGFALSHHSAQHPIRDTLAYYMDADHHSAAWISYDRALDPWTAQFFASGRGADWRIPECLATSDSRSVFFAPAYALKIDPPEADVKSDGTAGGIRTMAIDVRSRPNARLLRLMFPRAVQISRIKVGTREIRLDPDAAPVTITLIGMGAQDTRVELVAKAPGKISFWLADQSSGLPLPVKQRPSGIIAGWRSDTTSICRQYAW